MLVLATMKHEENQKLLDEHSDQHIIDVLEPYLTESRKERINNVLCGRLSSIHLAIEAPSDINNALAAVRSAESLGVNSVHFITLEGTAHAARTITQGACYWINICYHENLSVFINYLEQNQIALAGGCPRATQTLEELPIEKPLCIIVGNEQRGLSDNALNACQHTYHIPMVGMSESLNLSVSAAISLYETCKRKRQHIGSKGDLSDEQKTQQKAMYFLNSISPRLASALLNKAQCQAS
jgi:tRNA (guanosine-2'-O-)-methyltransferase